MTRAEIEAEIRAIESAPAVIRDAMTNRERLLRRLLEEVSR